MPRPAGRTITMLNGQCCYNQVSDVTWMSKKCLDMESLVKQNYKNSLKKTNFS